MLQEAIVTKTREDGLAEVVVERLGVCGGDCDGCDGCQYENRMKSLVHNPVGARRGQQVMIETPTAGVVKGALIIYILPVFMMILGYALGALLSFAEGRCILLCFVFLIIGVLIAVVLSKRQHSKDPVPGRIVSIK